MSIGFKSESITLVSSTTSEVISFRATKGYISLTDYKITITEWGDDLAAIISPKLSVVPSETPLYYLNGLTESGMLFYRDINASNYCVGTGSPWWLNHGMTLPPYQHTGSDASFGGFGLYVVVDNSHDPTRPRYAFVTATGKKVNGVVTPYLFTPCVLNMSARAGYVVDGINYPFNLQMYTDRIYENYTGSDYDPVKANGLTVYGFPYGDGESTSQGGQGEMTDTSDPIEIDSKPLLTTGDFLRVYKMTATDLTALQNKLISNGFLDGLIPKLRTDAMDYIVGLNAIPINAANVAASTIKIANLDTEIAASYLSWYIEDIDFGEIALTEYFQTFMDYSPYTKLSAYIPYCGIVPLNVDNFMNDKIAMKCRVDMLTGQFVVFVSNSVGVVTTVSGNCAYQLPIRANDYNRLVTSGLGLLGGIVGTAGALATGNIPLAVGAGLGTVGGLVATSQAMTKPDVISKGSLGGNYGLLGNRTPYLIIQRPSLSVPSDYGKTIGYMSRITAKLGDLTGYTVVEEIHLEHISATDDEKRLIENALKSGVIL